MSDHFPVDILVTGAGGFVGRHLARHLLQSADPDARLTALLIDSDPPEGFDAVYADIADEAKVDAIVASLRPSLIVHLAAQASVGASASHAAGTWRTNVGGAYAMAAACARHVPDATVLFVSSGEVYGESFRDGPVTEETMLRPQNAYARSKAAAEAVFVDVLSPNNPLIVPRPFNHSGAGQDERFVLPSFAAQIAAIEAGIQPPVMHIGNLKVERDFLHVEDVCKAYIALIKLADRLPKRSVFNICSGTAHPLQSILGYMRSVARVPFDIVVDPARLRPNDIERAVGHCDKLVATIGTAPKSDPFVLADELLNYFRTRSIPNTGTTA
jgi:GDP-4-dehydro-6-deoxy-D-mannose reductase